MAKKGTAVPLSELEQAVSDREAEDLVTRLLATRGGSGCEAEVMAIVASELAKAGLPEGKLSHDTAHRRSVHGGEIGNAILRMPGKRKGPRRLFSAHTDTVPICLGARPVKKNGFITSSDPATGLGADDRSGTAVLLTTAIALLRTGAAHLPLTLLWLVQEETGLHGAKNVTVSKLGGAEEGYNFDGGDSAKLRVGATGAFRLDITVSGIPSHAGMAPEKGVSAIAIASVAIADLVENGWQGLIEKGKKTGTSNIGVFHGGEATNVLTDRVKLRGEARSHDPAFRKRIVSEIEKAFARAAKKLKTSEGRRGAVAIEVRQDYESFRLKDSDPVVVAATMAIEHCCGVSDPVMAVANGGLDANWLTAHGVPTVTMGCGQENIHTVDERLNLKDFHLARRIALRLATSP
ncbi:Peptidase T [Pseudobythopirellula maris]|uniref:Peptidase T n=1 Tax=Pseudobythopirellula maris TaxID=2527991 RepID=A0A5C5ZMN1_9BACT|nr:M20/M25/M40 family metallo-hydrolase [Pseudobythopirellula maris]TWT88679.1 Peptidase T [Pseudobythopirellula maris]